MSPGHNAPGRANRGFNWTVVVLVVSRIQICGFTLVVSTIPKLVATAVVLQKIFGQSDE